ncbi:MAG: RNA polymerase sigma factor [Myxococcales bacterium]|nr:RNA polymerase sigma factor [Myxococcales bacterium]
MAAVARSPAEFSSAPRTETAPAADDQAAAHALLVELAPRIRNLVRYLIRGDVDVDDIAQEAMVAVLKNRSDYRGDGPFSAWVDRIVVRTTFTALRRRKRRREEPLHPEHAEPVHDAFGEFHSRRQLVAMLDRLPPPQRHAVVLHYALGMTVFEIAEELETSAETIRSRLRLAKTVLRRNLESAQR